MKINLNVDLNKVHFCKASKAKYRVHLTVGMIVSTILSVVGTAFHHDGMTYFALGANLITALLWIWE